jgi:hypothetical protein
MALSKAKTFDINKTENKFGVNAFWLAAYYGQTKVKHH